MTREEILDKVHARIDELVKYAQETNEEWNIESAQRLIEFVKQSNYSLPHIFLLDNGNFKAYWNNSNDSIGIQFFDGGLCTYVFYSTGRQHILDGKLNIPSFDDLKERIMTNATNVQNN